MLRNKVLGPLAERLKTIQRNRDVRKAKRDVQAMIKEGILKKTPSPNSEFITGYFTVER